MKRSAQAAALLVAIALLWRFPLFHVVRLGELRSTGNRAEVNAAEIAEAFWEERLLPSIEEAPEAGELVAALRTNPREAHQQFGRSVGISRGRLVCVRGSGTIVSVDKQGTGVSLASASGSPDLVLQTGLLFGNTVRDASGLLDAGEFSNSQHYNDISTELNRIVETRVIPELKERAELGTPIKFYACGQLQPDSSNVLPLRLIPLKVDFDKVSTP
jgi:predicted lipoprotein